MLGVCYYPEHWPEALWSSDAQEMHELGLKYVRLAEFAWCRLEPSPGVYDFSWLDHAIDTLGSQGLQVILCTPTATPPKWLIDQHPHILPIDIHTGQTRGFGSRRHYDFSSPEYREAAIAITQKMAQHYANNPHVVGWQTDNELACHDTTHSGSEHAKQAFQAWCKKKYGTITALNAAWGTIFWSMEYRSFAEIELPILTVTEAHPAHQLAYRRFSSDAVIEFHNALISCLRHECPNHFITHNFIPIVDTQCNDHALAAPLDFVSYDNYPLGRTDLFFNAFAPDVAAKYMRTGHPDYSTYSFDHMRGLKHLPFWIMEQQPGPVNWGGHNPAPEPGMVRLWSWEAVAHGASTMCYFRWRQAAFAQEQMHAGIKRVDNSKAPAWFEISQFRDELALTEFPLHAPVSSKVAIVLDEHNQWVTEIERQGDSFNQAQLEFAYYSTCRRLGWDVEFISQDDELSSYSMVIAPCLPIVKTEFVERCKRFTGQLIFGPRSGSKTAELSLAPNLAPGELQTLLPITVELVETIRGDISQPLSGFEYELNARSWCEQISFNTSSVQSIAQYSHNHRHAIVANSRTTYIGCVLDDQSLEQIIRYLAVKANLDIIDLPCDVRLAQRGDYGVLINYHSISQTVNLPFAHRFILGTATIEPRSVAVYKR